MRCQYYIILKTEQTMIKERKQTIANIINGVCIFILGIIVHNLYSNLGINVTTFLAMLHAIFLISLNGIPNYGTATNCGNKSDNNN